MNLFKNSLPQVKCNVVFKTSVRLSDFFPFKDRVPLLFKSFVVYKYTCSNCNVTYYGKTKRHLFTRIGEHCGISALTGKTITGSEVSAIKSHISTTGHTISKNDFKILASAPNDYFLKVKESLLIKLDNPVLNSNETSAPLSLF